MLYLQYHVLLPPNNLTYSICQECIYNMLLAAQHTA